LPAIRITSRSTGSSLLALYRSGRQGDALAAFRSARGRLADELGIEPGADLRRMQQAILRQESGTRAVAGRRPAPTRPSGACLARYSPAVPAAPPRRRRTLIAAGLALAVTGHGRGKRAAGAAGGGGASVPANGIGVLSASGTSVASALAMPSALASLAVGAGSVWATEARKAALCYRIDPATRAITRAIAVAPGPAALPTADGDVWVANASAGTRPGSLAWPARWCRRSALAPNPRGSRSASGRCGSPIRLGSTVSRIDLASGS